MNSNTKHSNTNRSQKNHKVQIKWRNQMNRIQNIECRVLKLKVLEYLKMQINKVSTCSFCFYFFVIS